MSAAKRNPKKGSIATGSTIRVVSTRTGLSMDTLRVWERRYGFPKPERRTGSNRRLYSEADIDRLLAITRALGRGYRVGDVITKSLPSLLELGDGPAYAPDRAVSPGFVDIEHLIQLVERSDLTALEAELRQAGAALGPKRFVTEVAHPFLVAVGAAWTTGRLQVRHEHLAAECLTTQLRHHLAAYQDVEAWPLIVLGTLPGEFHTLGLQMVALYLAVRAAKPRLIGASTPAPQFAEAVRSLGADVVGLTVTSASEVNEARRGVKALLRELPAHVRVWIGGSGAPALGIRDERVRVIASWADIDAALGERRRAS